MGTGFELCSQGQPWTSNFDPPVSTSQVLGVYAVQRWSPELELQSWLWNVKNPVGIYDITVTCLKKVAFSTT